MPDYLPNRLIENGIIHFPEEAAWLPAYIQELTTFPKGKNDDQVDSTAQALAWIKKGFDESAYLVFMREQLRLDRALVIGSGI